MSSSELVKLVNDAFDYRIHGVHTAIPCVILNVREINQQRVDVQPCINSITPSGEFREHTALTSVPLMFPATNQSALTFEVKPGDTVLCVFSQRGIDSFKAGNGEPTNPIDFRQFSSRDAVAIVGLFPFGNAITDPVKRTWDHNNSDTVLVHNIGTVKETEIRLLKNGGIVINTNQDINVQCSNATILATTTTVNGNAVVNGDVSVDGDISCTGTITASTDVVGGGKSLASHIHGGVQSGGSTTSPPT